MIVAQQERIDSGRIDFRKSLGDQVTKPIFSHSVNHGTEIELGKCVDAVRITIRDAIEYSFEIRGEVVVDKFSEVLFEQRGYRECIPTGNKCRTLLPHIATALNGFHD